jgi:hypothetical protein
MTSLAEALIQTADFPQRESLETFRASIDPEWIEQALLATGAATLRRRRLPAEQVIWLVLGMALLRDRPIMEVLSKLDLAMPDTDGDTTVASSSIAKARQRVGAEPLQWLFRRCSRQWALESAKKNTWRKLSLFALDGTTLRVADSEQNREYFGPTGSHRGDSGYPLVRVAALITARSHLLLASNFGPYTNSEHALAETLWPEIPDDSLTLVDRNFLAAKILVGISGGGNNRHWLMRAKKNTKWRIVKSFGRYDKLVELDVSSPARKADPTLPKIIVARAIGYRHPGSKGRQWLLTSLIDAREYPAQELIVVYHERWEIELSYDEVKTHLLIREETIRSKTVDGVNQEIWGVLLTYNLIRLEMEKIADEAEISPSRISFVMAMRYIRDEWMWCAIASPGSIPAKLRKMRSNVLAFVLSPRRSERRYPRVVKMSNIKYAKNAGIKA